MSTLARRPHSNFVYDSASSGLQLHGLSDGAVASDSEVKQRIQYLKETTGTGSYSEYPTLRSRLQREIEKRSNQYEEGGSGLSHRLHRYYSQFGNDADAVIAEWQSKGWVSGGSGNGGGSTGGSYPVVTAGGGNTMLWVVGGAAALGVAYMVMKKD